ncbi:MAG: hypothetical protein JNN26_25740, partial [Candidatus Obscuribacter sp.]|nr:hypothetical protein [Candidatus Obscuribacter sp.]
MKLLESLGPVWMKQFRAAARADFEEEKSLSEIQDALFTLAESGEGEDRAKWMLRCERLDDVMAHLSGAKEIRCELIEKLVAALPPFVEAAYDDRIRCALMDSGSMLSTTAYKLELLSEKVESLSALQRLEDITARLVELAREVQALGDRLHDQSRKVFSLEMAEA